MCFHIITLCFWPLITLFHTFQSDIPDIPIVNTKLLPGYYFSNYIVLLNYYLFIIELLAHYYNVITEMQSAIVYCYASTYQDKFLVCEKLLGNILNIYHIFCKYNWANRKKKKEEQSRVKQPSCDSWDRNCSVVGTTNTLSYLFIILTVHHHPHLYFELNLSFCPLIWVWPFGWVKTRLLLRQVRHD